MQSAGRPTGEKEYITPKSESLVHTGGLGEVMSIDMPAALKVGAQQALEQEVA
jgi:hypothetical protein